MKLASIVVTCAVFAGCIIEIEEADARVPLESGIIAGRQAGGTLGPKSFSGTFEFSAGVEGLPGYDLSPLNLFAFNAMADGGATGAISGTVVSGDTGFAFEGTFTIDDFEVGSLLIFDATIVDSTDPVLANAQDPILSGFFLTVLGSDIDGEFAIDALAVPEPSATVAQFFVLGSLAALRRRALGEGRRRHRFRR
jgi:hypothetical protein